MRERSARRGLAVAGLAGIGVILAHWLAYAVAVPDPVIRHDVLVHTGHGYWPLLVKGASAFAVVGVLAMVGRIVGLEWPGTAPGLAARPLAMRLALLQMALFAVMETVERLAANAPLSQMFSENVFVLGLVLQVLVALVGAAALRAIERVAIRLARAVRSTAPLALPIILVRLRATFPRSVTYRFGAAGVRGPPIHPF